jgi:SPP1 gp7 family putative phage head morphogenesis protein
MSVNDEIYDRLVDNAAMSRLYENEVNVEVDRIVRRHAARLGKIAKGKDFTNAKQVRVLTKPELLAEVKRFNKELAANVDGHMKDFGSEQLDFHTNNIDKALGEVFKVRRPRTNEALDKLVGINIEGDYTLSEQIARISSGEMKRIDNIINNGVSKGLTNNEMIEKIVNSTKLTKSQANALVRTSLTRSATMAQVKVMESNEALIKGYKFTAVLDSRTSQICSSRDGNEYPLDDKSHLPPLHWRCRSTITPITKSYSELMDTKSDRVRKKVLKALPERELKKLDGRSPDKEGYGQWLKRQSQEVKLRHFDGDEERLRLFEHGSIRLKQFFGSKGKKVNIATLRRLDNRATTRSPTKRKVIDMSDKNAFARKPSDLRTKKELQQNLKEFYINEANARNSNLGLTDFKGTSLKGKSTSRGRAENVFDDRVQMIDPITGEAKNTLLYDPDFGVYQERIDFLRSSKLLTAEDKDFIENFVGSLDDTMSVNQQSATLENLRLIFERYNNPAAKSYKQPWENLEAVIRDEMKNSVVNVSRILDRRSRTRAKNFDSFFSGDPVAKMSIGGKQTSFDDLSRDLARNQKFIDEWKQTEGRALARSAYFRGRSPLRTYFFPPVNVKLVPEIKPRKWVEKSIIDNVPLGKRIVAKLKGEPTERLIEELVRRFKNKVNIRAIIDKQLEQLSVNRQYHKMLRKGVDEKLNDNAIEALSSAFETIAGGTTTDYDSLAIQIGKQFIGEKGALKGDKMGKYPLAFPFKNKPTMSQYHKVGSELLDMLEKQGKLKIGHRGVTRRAVNDLETGRPGGPWRDTLSREVIVVDPKMLAYQEAQRKLYVGRRIGFVDKKNELIALPNQQAYLTKDGRATGNSLITRRAGANYDKVQIDRDIADEINHANSFEWEIDEQFGSFMLDMARFRDPRGQVAKYDDLNGFRQIVLDRGEQGLGMMETVKWHLGSKKPFKNSHQIDGRGRIYANGYLTPTGGEFVRPFLNTHKDADLGIGGWINFQEQVGSLLGPATEALTNPGRFAIFDRNKKELLELGRLAQSSTQRDRRIREALSHPMMVNIDPVEHPKLIRLALEYARMHDHVEGDFTNLSKLSSYRTKLPVEIDASASGAQIIALSTKNKSLGYESNVVATPKKNRLYDTMAMDTVSDPRFQRINELVDDITWEDLSKAAKAQNMVAFYGAGQATQANNIADKFAKTLLDRDKLVVVRNRTSNTPKDAYSLGEINRKIDDSIKDAEKIGANESITELKDLRAEINDSILKEAPVGSKIMHNAKDAHPDVQDFVEKLAANPSKLVGPNEFKLISDIMADHLERRAPVTGKFINFWKGAAEEFIEDTGKVDIPWVTFDGKTMTQRYRPTIEQRIEFTDPVTGRRVYNVYKDSVTDGKLKGRSSIIDARTGYGVNGNHSNDAAIVRQFHLWGKDNDVKTATIHDAFFVNVGEATQAKDALRGLYADAVESDTILNTLNAMRKQGLSDKAYNKLLAQAKADGLIVENGLTAEDILSPIPIGESWYGIGP